MADIKIFVAHRIDLNSELISNPLYFHMRCGAVYDNENCQSIMGDNTGDNISKRRISFCEFTVQYWAWKNAKADYYGLCHYRRYLAFTEKRYPVNEHNMIYLNAMLPMDKHRYGLLDSERMQSIISKYDIITSEPAPVCSIPTPNGTKKTVREMWNAHDGKLFKQDSIDLMLDLIKQLAPEYNQAAQEYLAGPLHRGYNCYVMKKELFDRLCQFQFPIMFALERQLDITGYTQEMLRTPAYIGEMLYGIFLYHVTTYEKWSVKELQMLFICHTERPMGMWQFLLWQMRHNIERCVKKILDPVLPIGSNRRQILKRLFFQIIRNLSNK